MANIRRSFFKACTWKILSTSLAMAIAFVMTGSVEIAVTIALAHIPLSLALYVTHEWLWDRKIGNKK